MEKKGSGITLGKVHATVWLVMPLAKMGRLGEEQVEKGNRNFCFDLFHFKCLQL